MNSSLNSMASWLAKANAFFVEGVLQAHDAETDGPVAHVGPFGGLGRVEVDVDDVVESANGNGDGFAERFEVERAVVADVGVQDDGAEIADGGFVVAAIEGDLGAEIR